jgi:hypothetical protein
MAETPKMTTRGIKAVGSGMSLETANILSFWGNWVLLAALIIGALATGVVIVSGVVKDAAFEKYKLGVAAQVAAASQAGIAAGEAAASAGNTAEIAKAEAAKANERTAELTASNLQLEAQISPRRITTVNQALFNALGQLAPKTIRLTSYSLDPDGAVLATQMFDGLTSQKFLIQDARMTQGPSFGLVFGVWIFGSNKTLVTALVNFFRNAGILVVESVPQLGSGVSFNVQTFSSQPDANIFVGLKPLPGMIAQQ